jgi:hypothetical protein
MSLFLILKKIYYIIYLFHNILNYFSTLFIYLIILIFKKKFNILK